MAAVDAAVSGNRILADATSIGCGRGYRAGPRHGNMPIFHADLYRIEEPGELASIGIEEAWSGIGVCLIEWADQAGDWLPSERLAIHLQHLSETKRVLRFVPYGARYQALLAEFKKAAVA